MLSASQLRMPGLVALSILALTGSSCTMSITVPLERPPDTWSPAQNNHPAGPALQALLEETVRRGLPGVVLLVSGPQGRWEGAAGFAKIETGDPMLPTHRHHGASITKMYTATATLLLAEEGVLELDGEISHYLPESVWRPLPNGTRATVRQLLGHTSGIPDFSGSLRYDLDTFNDPLGSFPPRRMLGYVYDQGSIFPPGEGYFYSNANYLLLALILDRVSGSGHADLVTRRILRPLDLTATYYKDEPGYPTPPGLVNSYQELAGKGRLVNATDLAIHSSESAAGYAGLMATAADYAAFLDALLQGEVVGPETLEAMLTPTRSPRYGLGLSLMSTPFGTAVGHGGGSFGIQGQVRHLPDHHTTLVLLSNGGDGGEPATLFNQLWDQVLELTLGRAG